MGLPPRVHASSAAREGHAQLLFPSGGDSNVNGAPVPGLAFASHPTTGFRRPSSGGIEIDVDGRRAFHLYRSPDGTTTSIEGTGTNRTTLTSSGGGMLGLFSGSGRFEIEGPDTDGGIRIVGYKIGTALGRAIRFSYDTANPPTSVLQIDAPATLAARGVEFRSDNGAGVQTVVAYVDAEGLVILSPDATPYRLQVANDGTLSTTAVV